MIELRNTMKIATCHPNRKVQARGLCKPCYDKHLKEINPKYKANQTSNTLKWMKANPEKYKIIQARRREKERNDPTLKRRKKNCWLKRKYNITIEQYDILYLSQNGSCALCFRKNPVLHVDHDHNTKKVRGLLCHQCNWYLGTIDADPTIINRIIKYRL